RGDPASPVDVAVIDCAPTVAPSVQVTETMPPASVTPLAADNDPPPLATVKVTVLPGLPTPEASVTWTTIGAPSALPTVPFWPPPVRSTRLVAAPREMSKLVLVVPATPVALADSV